MTAKKRLPDDLTYISDKKRRDVSYCKRKRGLIKKIIELSNLCHHDIYLVIFEKEKQKIVEYRTDVNFNSEIISGLLNPDIIMELQHELYTNKTHQETFMSRDEEIDPLASEPENVVCNNKSAFKRLTGSMSNIKNNFKAEEIEQNENQFIDNSTIENHQKIQKLKQKLTGYLIPENQRKGKRKASIKRNLKIQEKINNQFIVQAKDNSSDGEEIQKRRKYSCEKPKVVKYDTLNIPPLIDKKCDKRIFQTVFHPKIVSKPIEQQDVLSSSKFSNVDVVNQTNSCCSDQNQEEKKNRNYESSDNFSFENIGAKLFKPKPVVKQEYLKQVEPVDQNKNDIDNEYFQKQQISQTEILMSENQSDLRKQDPTKLLTISNIDFESFKPLTKQVSQGFSFSSKDDRELMTQKVPEFKFKDYHDQIDTFITQKIGKPSKDESIQESSDPIQKSEEID